MIVGRIVLNTCVLRRKANCIKMVAPSCGLDDHLKKKAMPSLGSSISQKPVGAVKTLESLKSHLYSSCRSQSKLQDTKKGLNTGVIS